VRKDHFLPQYAARAILDLEMLGRKMNDREFGLAHLAVAALLRDAMCFVLPPNAEIYRSNIAGGAMPSEDECQSTMGLPADLCAFEYAWTHQPLPNETAIPGGVLDIGRKRITIALDQRKIAPDAPARVILFSVFYSDSAGGLWMLSPISCILEIPLRVTPPLSHQPRNAWGVSAAVRSIKTVEQELIVDSALASKYIGEMFSDITAVVQTCHALRCGGSMRSHVEESPNRRRLFEAKGVGGIVYHTVVLPNQDNADSVPGVSGGTHAAPRHHFRRGHVRHLSTGMLTWVRQCFVGSKDRGEVRKDYLVSEGGRGEL
jgi:hypothetical protein